jgi:hypothetical protein
MAFGTLNSILSTAVSITYTCCCAIVLMLHNVLAMHSNFNFTTMTAEEIHIKKLKELGYKDEPIKEIVNRFHSQQKYLFAEKIHQEKLKLLGIGGVTPRYSVSLVFVNARENLLRCLITDSSNEHEALGKALDHFKEETKGFNLSMKVVLPANNVG